MPRKLRCPLCRGELDGTPLWEHITGAHDERSLAEAVVKDMRRGAAPATIGRRYGISFRKLELLVTDALGVNVSSLVRKRISSWEPPNFALETNSVWSFKSRGGWATHNGNYRGNWSPYIPRNVILRYSSPGELVLDAFLGGGTTAVEAKLLGRRCVGLDINSAAVELSRENLDFVPPTSPGGKTFEPEVRVGDARDLSFLFDDSVDLICTHPPYAGVITYSAAGPGDLSHLTVGEYLDTMEGVAAEFYRVLKAGRQCAVLLGDTRRQKRVVPLGLWTIERFLRVGFRLRELIIKRQHNCRTTGFWYDKSIAHGFLLLAHEYLPIFEKPALSGPALIPAPRSSGFGWVIEPPKGPPQTAETTTVWLLPSADPENALLSNLQLRFAPEGGLVQAVPSCDCKPEAIPADTLVVRFPEDADVGGALGWVRSLPEVIARSGARFLAVESRDVRHADGTIEPMSLRVLQVMRDLRHWSLKENIVLVDAPRAPNLTSVNLAIVHRYLMVFERENTPRACVA